MTRTIRPATLADIQSIVGLGQQLFAESPRWSKLHFNAEKLTSFVYNLIEAEDGFVCVAEIDAVIVGAIMGVAMDHYAADDVTACELALFVAPSHRSSGLAQILIAELDQWAKSKGAAWLQAGTTTGVDPERTAKLYEACGFTRCGIVLEVDYVHGR
jgi:GNAT superfamily N-acetyltransferase